MLRATDSVLTEPGSNPDWLQNDVCKPHGSTATLNRRHLVCGKETADQILDLESL